jgi:hypothetical protein
MGPVYHSPAPPAAGAKGRVQYLATEVLMGCRSDVIALVDALALVDDPKRPGTSTSTRRERERVHEPVIFTVSTY